eukprot:m.26107 g.26107  ORF g.26107 m.26107 type:complete len:566 (-) comp15279_c0_seq1:54-1751(-)
MEKDEKEQLFHLVGVTPMKIENLPAHRNSWITPLPRTSVNPALSTFDILSKPASGLRNSTNFSSGLPPSLLNQVDPEEPITLEDKKATLMLLLLYTLQGIPMGLATAMPFILSQAGVGYGVQAVFSLCTWPYSLKLLWAPIVDSVYSKRIGRRKSWLIPVLVAGGATMMFAGSVMDRMLLKISNLDNKADTSDVENLQYQIVSKITALFFIMYILMATQDIAVDGWATTMLNEKYVELGSTCSTIGQRLGFFLSFVMLLTLSDVVTCNTYLRIPFSIEPKSFPIVTLGGFLQICGTIMLLTSVLISVTKGETVKTTQSLSVSEAYKELLRGAKQPGTVKLFVLLITCKLGTAVTDNVTNLKMIEYGFKKEEVAMVIPLLLPLGLAVLMVSRRFEAHPLQIWLAVYRVRVLVQLLDLWVVYEASLSHMHLAYAGFVWLSFLTTILTTLMFAAQIRYFTMLTVDNHTISGSYMTMLNSFVVLGDNWTQPVALWLVDVFSVVQYPCHATPRSLCIRRDGFFPLVCWSILVGLLWLITLGPLMQTLSQNTTTPRKKKENLRIEQGKTTN